MIQANGDAVILIVADLQDPPKLISEFIRKWEEGYKLVIGVKTKSEESFLFFGIRKSYYYLINKLSDTELVKNFTGFGLYDREVINALRKINDTYPYLRGLVSELGYDLAKIEYEQPLRKRGFTKNNFYTLYDMAMLGITNHSKIPLRLATFIGFVVSILSLLIGTAYLIFKIMFFDRYEAGIAPLVIGLFFFGAVQLFFIGIIGEYVGSIHTQVLKRPLVIEKERINFE
jgi:glycosyltransferase involved in cell wall biosynthesis